MFGFRRSDHPDDLGITELSMIGQPELWNSHRDILNERIQALGRPVGIHHLHFDLGSPYSVSGNPRQGQMASITPVCGVWTPLAFTEHRINWDGYYTDGRINIDPIAAIVSPLVTALLATIPSDRRRGIVLGFVPQEPSVIFTDRWGDGINAIIDLIRTQVDAANAIREGSARLVWTDGSHGWIVTVIAGMSLL